MSDKELTTVPAGPWDRQKGEPPRAYSALVRYLQMGPERSYAKMVKEYNYNEASLYRWAKKHGWPNRTAAYDEYMNREIMVRLQAGLADMCERHVKEAQMLQGKAIEKLRSLAPSDLSASDISRFLDTAVKIERQSRGINDGANIQVTATSTSSSDMMKLIVGVVLETVEDPEVKHRIGEKLDALMKANKSDG